ncbi:MAG: SMI1/KNR4 family protein [Chloroflexi bacterium]|uniref:SMI1/KNR4 family protein n=1 Tax=Candidatus Chlorohelix allophototropha TaxID=3003348 RepID=A0A8T7M413_9CHLR|nr:SMI1/KNR4 family protein [Chloroflexota bacterium]WJW70191.1 SMI1/KNR4 family protein [Chloroflexota bacterium L227-S17]
MSAIQQAEKELGVQFPDSYCAFLLEHNGGHPLQSSFPLTEELLTPRGSIHWFFCIDKSSVYDIRKKMRTYEDRVPSNFLTIAADPGGNLICISFKGVDAGKVYYWDHEGELDKSSVDSYENVYLIANTFEEFINSLTEEDLLETSR